MPINPGKVHHHHPHLPQSPPCPPCSPLIMQASVSPLSSCPCWSPTQFPLPQHPHGWLPLRPQGLARKSPPPRGPGLSEAERAFRLCTRALALVSATGQQQGHGVCARQLRGCLGLRLAEGRVLTLRNPSAEQPQARHLPSPGLRSSVGRGCLHPGLTLH